MHDEAYVRFPTIYGSQIVFSAEDDLWTVPSEGGVARRLTTGLGAATQVRFTPDGRYLVYVGHEEGESDLYRLAAEGGPVQRLTFTGGVAALAGFDPDGAALAAVTAKVPFGREPAVYRVPLDGGPMTLKSIGPALAVSYGPSGGMVLGRKTQDPATWKRYRGGTTGELWIDPEGSGTFFPYRAPQDGNLTAPLWIGSRIYFLSDYEGVGNLYSIRPDGTDLRRHTDHEAYYARNPATDGHHVVYHAGGELFLFDPGSQDTRQVHVDLKSQRTQRARRFVDPARYLTEFAPDPRGERLLVTTRGQLFDLAPFEGPVTRLSAGSGVRVRLARALSDGRVVYCDDAGGEDRMVIAGPGREPTVLWADDIGEPTALEVDPTGARVAYVNHRLELWVVDIAERRAALVERNDFASPSGLAWSPDGRFLAYSSADSPSTTGLVVLDTRDGSRHQATHPVRRDASPAWDPEGRYLYFLGSRFLDPVYDQATFDMGFPRAVRPYLVTLTADTPSPFLGPPIKKAAKDQQEDSSADRAVRIDFERMADRVVPFPVEDGQYRELAATADKVLWTVFPVQGELSRPTAEEGGTLTAYDLTTRESTTLAKGVQSFRLGDGDRHVVYRTGHRLRWVNPNEKLPEEDKVGRKGGYLDWSRVPVLVDPPLEWAEMLREAWRMMRYRFWTEDMSQVDWAAIYAKYAALLPRVATRGEFSDLVWEMQGELGTSHAYESGGDHRLAPEFQPGYLGADFLWDDEVQGWRITHIVQGDPAVPGHESPLRTPGANVQEGDVVVAVDGERATPQASVESLLQRRRDREVALTVVGASAGERTVVVRTLKSEQLARYREWVERNRAYVHRESGGRVGYLHIPNMMAWGFSEFFRLHAREVQHEALIVDVRFNSGGHVSPLLLEKLARRPVAYAVPRWGVPRTYPGDAARGPVVALTNDYAGSDGDIFSHNFKQMGIGTLVGRRTWGGVIGINPRYALVDGTRVTQPTVAYWFKDVGWGVENHGTDPDIVVEYPPQAYRAGEDPQLQRTVAEALAQLAAHPAETPPHDPRPNKMPPPLPARPR